MVCKGVRGVGGKGVCYWRVFLPYTLHPLSPIGEHKRNAMTGFAKSSGILTIPGLFCLQGCSIKISVYVCRLTVPN